MGSRGPVISFRFTPVCLTACWFCPHPGALESWPRQSRQRADRLALQGPRALAQPIGMSYDTATGSGAPKRFVVRSTRPSFLEFVQRECLYMLPWRMKCTSIHGIYILLLMKRDALHHRHEEKTLQMFSILFRYTQIFLSPSYLFS